MFVVGLFTLLIIINNVFAAQIENLFSFVGKFIEPSIVILFFSVVLIIWGFASILLLQVEKGKQLFVHKIWRIMPAIMGLLFFLSAIILIVLGVMGYSKIPVNMYWLIDMGIIYFLLLFYVFILSIMLRYGKKDTNKGLITKSANIAILIILVILFLIPLF